MVVVVVALSLRCQNSVLRLSVLLKTVRSQMPNDWARAPRCNNPPASSRSEFEVVLLRLTEVISLSVMYFSHS